jgi:hypothetical protein
MPISFMSRSWIRVEVVVIMRGNNDALVEDEAGKFATCFGHVLPWLNVLIQVNRYSNPNNIRSFINCLIRSQSEDECESPPQERKLVV